jgi:hypothetical protein
MLVGNPGTFSGSFGPAVVGGVSPVGIGRTDRSGLAAIGIEASLSIANDEPARSHGRVGESRKYTAD